MKLISWRRFRQSFPVYAEPVQVTRRGDNGETIILGTWSPSKSDRDGPAGVLGLNVVTERPLQGAFGRPTPAPKPKR